MWRHDPRFPFTVVVVLLLGQVWFWIAQDTDIGALGFVALFFVVAFAGFYGTERVWFVVVDRGLEFTWYDIKDRTRKLWSRYIWLGVLVSVCTGVPFSIILSLTGDDALLRSALALLLYVPLDVALTFATVVLAFHNVGAEDAVRRSVAILRAEWPDCAWFVLVPPLAVNIGFQILPNESVSLTARFAVGLAVELVAVLCKGATVLFYADRYPIPGMPDPVPGEEKLH